jgi:hypothetical protein
MTDLSEMISQFRYDPDWTPHHQDALEYYSAIDLDSGVPGLGSERELQANAVDIGRALIRRTLDAANCGARRRSGIAFDLLAALQMKERPTAHKLFLLGLKVAAEVPAHDPDYDLFRRAIALFDYTHVSSHKITEFWGKIILLPSRAGMGHISSFPDNYCEPTTDGWCDYTDTNIFGVAIEPDSDHPGVRKIRDQLATLGIVFLSEEEAKKYMETEGAYWLEFHQRRRAA